jgi:hypothetical protein
MIILLFVRMRGWLCYFIDNYIVIFTAFRLSAFYTDFCHKDGIPSFLFEQGFGVTG